MVTRVVLGGGLGGLAGAKYMRKTFPRDPIYLLESSSRTGGWVKSMHLDDGTLFEQGPRTIRPKGEAGENTLELIEDLNLQNEVLPITSKHPAATNRMIYVNGKLNMLPNKFSALFSTQPPFSKPLISYLMHDAMLKKKRSGTSDESIYDFTSRRFGKEVADYLISPMICGICAGNAKEISVKFLMERLYEYEQEFGSVTKGVISSMFRGDPKERNKLSSQSALCLRSKKEKWNIYSLKNGLEALPDALVKHLKDKNVTINLETEVTKLDLQPKEITVKTNKGEYKAKHVLSSIPAQSLANLVKEQHPSLGDLLRHIPRVTVAVVNLKYSGNHIKDSAFGFLTAPDEKIPILGVIYDSCCFSCKGNTVLTVMMGGYWFQKYFGKNPPENYLFSVARNHVSKILGITEFPVEYHVNVMENCIPQYVVGHYDNVKRIEDYIKSYKLPLSICGSSYYGVGINDVILGAKRAVEELK